jgi:hypothetical protein
MSGAEFSECKKYRYSLFRDWDNTKPVLGFCMLNPSTADEVANDPTIARCQRRAELCGYGGIVVVNIFAFRSTDPNKLYNVKDPIGPDNDLFISNAAARCRTMICGWGKHGSYNGRGEEVLSILKKYTRVCALKVNKDGSPSHPLYIGYDVEPVEL